MALLRKKSGNYLEDFRVGQVFRHKGGRTITAGLHAHFTDFSMTTNPLHKNLRYALVYGFEDMLVFWEAVDDNGDGTGEYLQTSEEENQEGDDNQDGNGDIMDFAVMNQDMSEDEDIAENVEQQIEPMT